MRWQSADRAAGTELAAPPGAPYLALVSEPDIILTESAAKRVALIAERQSKPAVLRLAVDGGGCAGFTYKFELADGADAEDTVAETDGVKLVVDPMSLDLVRGSAVDFVEDLGGAAFKVTNPNAQSGCGCGSSFSV
jgi:iron-sulfur cluster insertion protein